MVRTTNKKCLHNFIHESRRLVYSRLYKNRNIQTHHSHWRLWAYTILITTYHTHSTHTDWRLQSSVRRRHAVWQTFRKKLLDLLAGWKISRAGKHGKWQRQKKTWRRVSQREAEENMKLFKRRYIPKDGTLRIHHREKTKSSTSNKILKSRL